ncbi:MAG: hypothetical protein D6713_09440, partial [Deltaproteobacteria bacterium]
MLGDPPVATPETVGEVRKRELLEASRLLGIREVFFMGFEDGKLVETDDDLLLPRLIKGPRRDFAHPHVVGMARHAVGPEGDDHGRPEFSHGVDRSLEE